MLKTLFFVTALAMRAEVLFVNAKAAPGGSGTSNKPFQTLNAAIAHANSLAKPLVIQVAAGRYEISEPLKIERSMTIKGSSQLKTDSDGLPTGALVDPAKETRIVTSATYNARAPMIFVGKSGEVIHDVKLNNLTLQAGPTGFPGLIHFARVQGFEVRDCIMLGRGDSGVTNIGAIDTYASSGTIRSTYTARLQGAAFIGAGYAQSPARVAFQKNRAVENVIGLFLVGTSDGITEPGDQLYAEVRDNDLSNSIPTGNGTGLRMVIKGNEGLVGGKTGLSKGNIQAVIQHNRIVGNRVGISIDSGFTSRRVGNPPTNVCDDRTFTGSMEITLRENQISGSILAPVIIAFTQGQLARRVIEATNPNYINMQFLHSATYNIKDPDGTLVNLKPLHPKNDPFTGPPCAADADSEELNNTLRINGVIVPNSGN